MPATAGREREKKYVRLVSVRVPLSTDQLLRCVFSSAEFINNINSVLRCLVVRFFLYQKSKKVCQKNHDFYQTLFFFRVSKSHTHVNIVCMFFGE